MEMSIHLDTPIDFEFAMFALKPSVLTYVDRLRYSAWSHLIQNQNRIDID